MPNPDIRTPFVARQQRERTMRNGYTLDATRWDDPRNEIVPLWMLERNMRERTDKRIGLACIGAIIGVGAVVNLWLYGPAVEHAVRYAVGMLV